MAPQRLKFPQSRHSSLAHSSSVMRVILQVLLHSSKLRRQGLLFLKCSKWKCFPGSHAQNLSCLYSSNTFSDRHSLITLPEMSSFIIFYPFVALPYFSSCLCFLSFSFFIALTLYFMFVYLCLIAPRRVLNSNCWMNK